MKRNLPILLLAACTREGDWSPYVDYAVRARGLELVEPVVCEVVSREDLLASRVALSSDHASTLQSGLGRLGFFDATDDLVALDRAQFGDNVDGIYREGRISVAPGSSWSLVVHEVVHALQDQHFAAFDDDRRRTTDAALAYAALYEGDAQLVQLAHQRSPHDVAIDRSSLIESETAERLAHQVLSTWTGPDWFVRRTAFVYGFGARYAAHVYAHEGGNAGLDRRLRETPPSTTQEVLRAGLELDAVEPLGTTWRHVVEVDSLGEWMCRLLFGRVLPDSDAEILAHAWDGDELVRFDDGGLAWTSIWDDEAAAARVHAALATLPREPTMVVLVRGTKVVVASDAALAEAALTGGR